MKKPVKPTKPSTKSKGKTIVNASFEDILKTAARGNSKNKQKS